MHLCLFLIYSRIMEMKTWPSYVGSMLNKKEVCNFQITASRSAFESLGLVQDSFFGRFYHDRNNRGQGYFVTEFADGFLQITKTWLTHPSSSRAQVIEILRQNQWQLISTATIKDGNNPQCPTVIDTFVK